MNAEQDVVRMSYFSPGNSYETYGYANNETNYWLASRGAGLGADEYEYGIRYIVEGRADECSGSWINTYALSDTCGVRPVVRVLKTDVGI